MTKWKLVMAGLGPGTDTEKVISTCHYAPLSLTFGGIGLVFVFRGEQALLGKALHNQTRRAPTGLGRRVRRGVLWPWPLWPEPRGVRAACLARIDGLSRLWLCFTRTPSRPGSSLLWGESLRPLTSSQRLFLLPGATPSPAQPRGCHVHPLQKLMLAIVMV